MKFLEIVHLLLEEWLPQGNWDRVREVSTEDLTYVDANNLATYGRDEVIRLLAKGNALARLIWKDQRIPANRVVNAVSQNDQIFVEWEAVGKFTNGVDVLIPGGTLVRFRGTDLAYYRDYVNFALFVQWAQQYPEVFQELASTAHL